MFAPGTILVADREALGGTGALFAINPSSGAQQVVASGGLFANPSAVAIEADGDLLVVDSDAFGGLGGVIRVNSSTGAQTPLSQDGLLVNPFAAAIEADGTIVIAATGGARMARVDPRTGLQRKILPRDTFNDAVDVAIDLDGSILVVANAQAGGELFRVDRVTGEPTPVPGADFHQPAGVAVAPDGILWVLEDRHGVGSSVVRFDPVSRQRTLLAAQGLVRGPFRVALETGGTLVIANPDIPGGQGDVVRVDRTSGAQSVVSRGGSFVNPFGIAVA